MGFLASQMFKKTLVPTLTLSIAVLFIGFCDRASSFTPLYNELKRASKLYAGNKKKGPPLAGSFFHKVPDESEEDEGIREKKLETPRGFATKPPPAQKIKPPNAQSFVGIGPQLNDPTKPEYDQDGYTLYADERTGKKSRVFEALVDYPCDFTMKIVGENHETFVTEMIDIVAQSCDVETEAIAHSTRQNGKWMSVTVQAPVQSADMLYQLYENVDRDPRVRFKF